MLTDVSGILIPFVSLVSITAGMKLNGTIFERMLAQVPIVPHRFVGIKSKLNICAINMIPKNCLINVDSGFTLKYIDESKIATIRAIE